MNPWLMLAPAQQVQTAAGGKIRATEITLAERSNRLAEPQGSLQAAGPLLSLLGQFHSTWPFVSALKSTLSSVTCP